MTLYELVNSTTIQGDVTISPRDIQGNEIGNFYVKGTYDLACAGWNDDWEDWTVTYIYVDEWHNLVIEIKED